MATGQPQQVVVVQQPPQQQQVVVMQQQQVQYVDQFGNPVQMAPATTVVQQPMQMQTTAGPVTTVVMAAPVDDDVVRFSRYAYLVFMIGFGVYHFSSFWWWFIISLTASAVGWGDHGTLFFFCGAFPAMICFIWTICDSTVFCANPGGKAIKKICCCECISGLAMIIPIILAAVLRLVNWIYWLGIILDIADDEGGSWDDLADNVFFFFLTMIALDCGPMIVLCVDWWFYYGRLDYEGVMGVRLNPLRTVVSLSIVIAIASWSLIAMFEGTGELWVVILHAVFCTAAICLMAFLNFTGQVQGNVIGSAIFRFICMGLGAAIGVTTLIVWIFIFILIGSNGWAWIFLFVALYYNGLMVPIVWGLFSFKLEAPPIVPASIN